MNLDLLSAGDVRFTPSRLTLARRRRGMTITQLADAVGLSSVSLSNYEHAKQLPSEVSLARLADILRFPPSFFGGVEVDSLPASAVSFRARSKLAAGKREGALASAELALEVHAWLQRHFRLPATDVPTLDKLDPFDAAEVVRVRWGLGTKVAPNMVHLLEAHGVRVFSLGLEYADVDAFSFWRGRTPFVFLNTLKTGERGRFDAAHELGHLVLHSEEREPVGKAAEVEANRFAAAFLMPRDAVLSRMPPSPAVDQILKGKRIWRVAATALTHRLHELGLLSDWAYRSALIELGRLGYRTGEPDGLPRETSKLLAQVFGSLRARGTAPARLAEELALTSSELNSLVFGLVPTVVNAMPGRSIRN